MCFTQFPRASPHHSACCLNNASLIVCLLFSSWSTSQSNLGILKSSQMDQMHSLLYLESTFWTTYNTKLIKNLKSLVRFLFSPSLFLSLSYSFLFLSLPCDFLFLSLPHPVFMKHLFYVNHQIIEMKDSFLALRNLKVQPGRQNKKDIIIPTGKWAGKNTRYYQNRIQRKVQASEKSFHWIQCPGFFKAVVLKVWSLYQYQHHLGISQKSRFSELTQTY